jgi:hypothetical protein
VYVVVWVVIWRREGERVVIVGQRGLGESVRDEREGGRGRGAWIWICPNASSKPDGAQLVALERVKVSSMYDSVCIPVKSRDLISNSAVAPGLIPLGISTSLFFDVATPSLTMEYSHFR